jgi:Uma2 family endonuclease
MGMPASTESRKRWTADEARALTAANPLLTPRYEVIDGELLVTPSPNRYHQAAVARLLIALGEYMRAQRIGHTLTSPFDVELAADTVVQPDVFVLPPSEWGPKSDPSPSTG